MDIGSEPGARRRRASGAPGVSSGPRAPAEEGGAGSDAAGTATNTNEHAIRMIAKHAKTAAHELLKEKSSQLLDTLVTETEAHKTQLRREFEAATKRMEASNKELFKKIEAMLTNQDQPPNQEQPPSSSRRRVESTKEKADGKEEDEAEHLRREVERLRQELSQARGGAASTDPVLAPDGEGELDALRDDSAGECPGACRE